MLTQEESEALSRKSRSTFWLLNLINDIQPIRFFLIRNSSVMEDSVRYKWNTDRNTNHLNGEQ